MPRVFFKTNLPKTLNPSAAQSHYINTHSVYQLQGQTPYSRSKLYCTAKMAATRMLLKTDPKLPFQFLRSRILAAPQLTKSVNEALNQKSSQTNSEFPLCEFLGAGQKLFTEEADFVKVHECLQNNVSSLGGSLVAQRAVTDESQRIEFRGSKKQPIDDEDEDEVDEDFDDVEDELEDDFDDSFDDESESDDGADDDVKEFKKKHRV